MANTVTALSYANTFGEWVIATNALITENNTFANTIYTKPRGTLYLQDPTLGVQVTANGIIGGQLLVQGTGSGAYVQNTLRVDGQATFANTTTSLTANGLVNLVGANTALNIANNANISGILTLTSTARLNANAATIYANNLLVTNSFTVGGSAMSTLAYTQAAFDKANTATNTATNTQAAFDKANSANVLAQTAFNAANTVATNLSANVTFSAAIDAAQNTRIQLVFDKANTAFSNTGGNVAGSILPSANVTYDLGSSSNVWSNVFTRNVLVYSPANDIISSNISQILVIGSDGVTVRKANVSNVAAAISVNSIPTMNTITATGTTTWVVPAGTTKVKVTLVGAGGGGGGIYPGSAAYPGTAGGTSSFGAYLSATGGGGGGCGITNGAAGAGGSAGTSTGATYAQGSPYYSIYGSLASSTSGSPGVAAEYYSYSVCSYSGTTSNIQNYMGGAGGRAGYGVAIISGLTPGSSITVTVGAGGGGGTNYYGAPGTASTAGSNGFVAIEY